MSKPEKSDRQSQLSQESAFVLSQIQKHHQSLGTAFDDLTRDLQLTISRLRQVEGECVSLRAENKALTDALEKTPTPVQPKSSEVKKL